MSEIEFKPDVLCLNIDLVSHSACHTDANIIVFCFFKVFFFLKGFRNSRNDVPSMLNLRMNTWINKASFTAPPQKKTFECFPVYSYPHSSFQDRVFGLVCFVCLFNGISTFVGHLMPKPFSKKNSSGTIWEDKGVHTFPKGICPKVNVIAQLEYKLAYYDSAVHRFNHYTMRTPPRVSVA